MGSVEPWGDRAPPENGETQRLDVGPVSVWLRRVENEVWIANRLDTAGSAHDTPPEDHEWSRWAFNDEPHVLRMRPFFPDRPLVVQPEHPFTLLSGAEARVYARVPVWVRLEAVEAAVGTSTLLTEIPTTSLSETWWGTFTEGELAYWLPTAARRYVTADLFEAHRIMCTLQLENRSGDDLLVEKLMLRVEHLSIFRRDEELWAEEVEVHYQGVEEGSSILMEDEPPAEASGARLISPPRVQSRSFQARTFARLKALSGLGG